METFDDSKIRRKYQNGNPDCRHHQHHLFGIVLVIIGAALILKNIGIFPSFIERILFSWQMLLVTIGLVITVGSSGEKTGGVIVMAIGAFFMIPKIFRETFDINIFWPVIFIIVGLIVIFSKHKHSRSRWKGHSETKIGENNIDIINVFSGSERQIMSDNFSGGKITSVFGGCEIDLTQSRLAQGVSELEIVCVFGGTVIIVPSDWNIKIEVMPVLGNFSDERRIVPNRSVDMTKQLTIKGTAVFGGGELKSYL